MRKRRAGLLVPGGSVSRRWGRPYARVVYVRTQMDGVSPEGFTLWKRGDDPGTMFFAEYGSTGAGASGAARASFVRQLTAAQAEAFAPARFLRGTDHWDAEKEAARLP